MGQAIVTMRIHGPSGSADVEALADTGATFSKVPRSTIDAVGIEPQYESDIRLGGGRTVTRSLASAEVEFQGVRRPVSVAFGADGEQPLIGYTTLEALGFKVNSVTHTLEPTPAIEY